MKQIAFLLLPLLLLSAEAATPPNLIIILADDLGWSDTSLYGQTTFHQTPHLERLARRGMTFSRAYSASPLCSPTRSALLTGLSPARTGITTPNCHVPQVLLETTLPKAAPPNQKAIQPTPPTRLKTEYITLAETLKSAGYATAHFGKWHLGPEPYSPLQQGFDTDLPHHSGPGPAGSFVAPWKFPHFRETTPSEHIEDRMAKEAVQWMQAQQQAGKPFFLNYWMFSVHAPFDAKKENIKKHRARINPQDAQRSPTYAAMIQSMDDAVGTLLDALDRLRLAEDTLIIFTSDNGGNMYNEVEGTTPTNNRPLRGGKATLYEGGTRVPCVVVWPGITAPGSSSDALVQSEDFYPTLVEGLSLSVPKDQQWDGSSILPALKGLPLPGKTLFQYFPHAPGVPDWLPPAVSVHRDQWKLIRIFHGGEQGAHRHLLFHLQEDLGERTDLSSTKPEQVKELDGLIQTFLTETKATVPQPNPAFDPKKYQPELEGKVTPKAKPSGKDDSDPALKGWKARSCKATVKQGILHLRELGDAAFLGLAAGKHSGPSTVRLRIKASEGASHIDWLPNGVSGKAQRVNYTLQSSHWELITVPLPATGPLGIIRLYLPMQHAPVEIDWIEISSSEPSHHSRMDF